MELEQFLTEFYSPGARNASLIQLAILTNKTPKIQTPNSRISQAPLLKGMMNCGICGSQMTPTYTSKNGRKYRYYICQAKFKGNNEECSVGRIPAKEAEELVTDQVLNILQKPEIISQTISCNEEESVNQNQVIESFQKIDKVWDELFPPEQARIINLLVRDITINPDGMNINIYKQGLNSLNNEING